MAAPRRSYAWRPLGPVARLLRWLLGAAGVFSLIRALAVIDLALHARTLSGDPYDVLRRSQAGGPLRSIDNLVFSAVPSSG